jgi:hypothetical protein
MNVTDPIRQVSVVSTGQVQIRPDHVASNWRPAFWWLLASRCRAGPFSRSGELHPLVQEAQADPAGRRSRAVERAIWRDRH